MSAGILPSRRARPWIATALALAAALAVSYVVYLAHTPEPHGGTPAGLAYGVAAAALLAVLFGLAVRKRAYRSRLGSLDGWLQAHLYLGLLTVPLVLAHAGFRFEDPLAIAAFAVLLAVVATGLIGARLYATVPRRLSAVEGDLSPEQLAEAIHGRRQTMARLAAGRSPAFVAIYRELDQAGRPGPLAAWRVLAAGAAPAALPAEEALLARVGPTERTPLAELLHEARRGRELHAELQRLRRARNLLEVWLYAHLPLAAVLGVLVAAHGVAAFYFGGV